jgi:hypothetical protein
VPLRPLRAIGIVAFMAVLAMWPVVIYLSRQRVWEEGTLWIVVVMLVSCLAFLIGCAIVLRSWTIGGMLIGLCVGVLLQSEQAAIVSTAIGFMIGAAIAGGKTDQMVKP